MSFENYFKTFEILSSQDQLEVGIFASCTLAWHKISYHTVTCDHVVVSRVSTCHMIMTISRVQAHDTALRVMEWNKNETWLLTADHTGNVKYWQSNMNNVKSFDAHTEVIRDARLLTNMLL